MMAMMRRLRNPALIVIGVTILLSFALPNVKPTFSTDYTGCCIDVFTQREPFSGRGMNAQSDAFGPEEILILYALVTYRDWPIENLLVAFHVFLPNNASFSVTAGTNSSGIASINFTIGTPSVNAGEGDIFGYWRAVVDAVIEGNPVEDSLFFRVDWIVKILSVRTIDENLAFRTFFGKGGDLGLEITARSVAMTMRRATIAVVIYDELSVPVNYTPIVDFDVPPNERLIRFYCKLWIPVWSYIGNATVSVSAFTAPAGDSGLPYCPQVMANFDIKSFGQIHVAFHDAAIIMIFPSATTIEHGQPLSASVLVRNEGTEVESFSLDTYFGDVHLGASNINALEPYAKLVFNYSIDTSSFSLGNYTLSALIPPVATEADLTDNNLVSGIIEIVPEQSTIIHDVAVTGVNASGAIVYVGDVLQIEVIVENRGTETETFSVSSFFDSKLIDTLQVANLLPASQRRLTFEWNTSYVNAGFYQIGATAPLDGDVNPSDNRFVDGTVEIRAKPPPPSIHDVTILSVTPAAAIAYVGTSLNISVVASNLGNYTESFDVTLNYDSQTIGTLAVGNLFPSANSPVLTFNWNTSGVAEGNYTLKASASQVLGEDNIDNNLFIDGIVEIKNRPVPSMIHDVAILSVAASPASVLAGDRVSVYVVVVNLGNYTESFNVTVLYDLHVVGTIFVGNLLASGNRTLLLGWDTQDITAGNYTLSASFILKLDENPSNNQYVDGVVEVKIGPPPPPPVHDVAVTNVVPAASFVYVGDSVNVSVTVKNKGDQPESFSVFLYYNNTGNPAAPSILVANLPKDAERTVIFRWSTQGLRSGNYTLIGYAEPVQNETSTLDNMYTDGVVKLASPIGGLFDFDWFWVYLLLILILILLLLLIIFLLYRRRKKRKSQQAFVSGWKAWYYCRNLKQIHRNTAFLDQSCERR